MKRAKNLYPKILTYDNLMLAFWKAARGKRGQSSVKRYQEGLTENIRRLQSELFKEMPDIGHYRFFTVYDPKVRDICAADFPERVLHHAVMNICEPILEACAIDDSYACRKGKGNRKAIARAQQFARRYPWYLKLDIHKYFDSIDHDIVLNLLKRRFKDIPLIHLFHRILASYHTEPGKGLPIGNLISQHMANFYLNRMDHFIKEEQQTKGYLRYMDDFILFSKSKDTLKGKLRELERFLNDSLLLRLNENIQLNRSQHGLPFLGMRIFPAHIRLSPRSIRRFSKKYRAYENRYIEGVWSENELIRHMEPLIDFTRIANAIQFRRRFIEQFGVLS